MKCSVFIATSADDYIATNDDSVEWLDYAGKRDADLGDDADMGFNNYISSIDCMIMGRNCMEKLSSFNLTPEQWPYGNIRIIAMSNTIKEAPENLRDRIEMYCGNPSELITKLESEGFKHAYIDGGATITSFMNFNLINEMTITKAPILLGDGKPLFGKFNKQINLNNAQVKSFPNDFIQIKYEVSYL